MNIFNKKKILNLQNNIKSCNETILKMSKELEYVKQCNVKLKEENNNLKFTLKHQRTY